LSLTALKKLLIVYLLLLVPIGWLAAKYDPYQLDGDAVNYMDLADLIRAHQWSGIVNGYWHPLYPAALAIAQRVFHVTRSNELSAYYALNFLIFLVSAAAMLCFVSALVKLRRRMTPDAAPLLPLYALQLLGLGLLVIAAQRELSMGKVRPDALLQALMLFAFAMLLEALATESLIYAPLMGMFLGLAYLTKSFAFVATLLSIAVMMLFQWWIQKRKLSRVIAGGLLAAVVFALIAGPYISALSKKAHRFDFGDSGSLNYAWYVSGTGKMHLEPWMTSDFGSANVHLVHPQIVLMQNPNVYSYRAVRFGTYGNWFDPAYFNDHVTPKFNARLLLKRDARNLVLSLRYLFNHPEAWILLALLLAFGARFSFADWRSRGFWLPIVFSGAAIWGIYGLVNVEERYITLAYLLILLPIFAALRSRNSDDYATVQRTAVLLIALFAFLALGETLRTSLEERRQQSAIVPAAWYSPAIFGAAKGLAAMGVQPGDEIACVGLSACSVDTYWQRLAGVRTLTEVYNASDAHLAEQLQNLPNRPQLYDVVRSQGAKVLVGMFDPGEMNAKTPASEGWVRLGATNYYALPLNLPAHPADATPYQTPWTEQRQVAP